jgi:hypothetical protein
MSNTIAESKHPNKALVIFVSISLHFNSRTKSLSFTTAKDLRSTCFRNHLHDIINIPTLPIPIIEGSKLKKIEEGKLVRQYF